MHLLQPEQQIFPPMPFQALSDLFPGGFDVRVGQSGQALRVALPIQDRLHNLHPRRPTEVAEDIGQLYVHLRQPFCIC